MFKRFLFITCIIVIALIFIGNANESNYESRLQIDDGSRYSGSIMNTLNGTKGVLYSQMVDTTALTGQASQLDTTYPFRADNVDDIMPDSTGWEIDSIVTWWNNWNGWTTWDVVKRFYVTLFEDSGSLTQPRQVAYAEYPVDSPNINFVSDSRVTLILDPPLHLTAGQRVWMGIMPVNDFSLNGQTGIAGADGIGNGNYAYLKFPTVGINTFTEQTYEIGMIIYGEYSTSVDSIYDVSVASISSPPSGLTVPGIYPVTARIRNVGNMPMDCYATAVVYDTTDMWNVVFYDSIILNGFASGADSICDIGNVEFYEDKIYYTEVFTNPPDDNSTNDSISIYSRTQKAFGDIIFEMDVDTITGDNQQLGIEFDGQYFYVTSGNNTLDPNKVYVIDTLGNLIWSLDQPAHSTSWGWRDLTWDGVRRDSLRIDTLYTSVNDSVDKFGIDLVNGTLDYYGAFPGPQNPNRALAYNADEGYFYTANFASGVFKFSKDSVLIDSTATDALSKYGAAYDSDSLEGNCLWFHTQDGSGLYIAQYDKDSLTQTGTAFEYSPAGITSGSAGGLCFWEGFRNADVLFALVQGNPHDMIVGLYLRSNIVLGIDDDITDIREISDELLISSNMNHGNMYFMLTGSQIHDICIMSVDGRVMKEYSNVKPGTLIGFGNDKPSGIYFITVQGTGISKKFTLMK